MMWNAVKSRIEEHGGSVRLNSGVVKIRRTGNRIECVVVDCNGREELYEGTDFLSSMAIKDFVLKFHPPPPRRVLDAAKMLNYRDFLTVCLIVNQPELFKDNWIYIHDPGVKVGRIENYKNWSPQMIPDPGKTSLGLEYFCTVGDGAVVSGRTPT